MKTELQTLIEQNRDRLASIETLENIIIKRDHRNADFDSLETSLKTEEELYAQDLKSIRDIKS